MDFEGITLDVGDLLVLMWNSWRASRSRRSFRWISGAGKVFEVTRKSKRTVQVDFAGEGGGGLREEESVELSMRTSSSGGEPSDVVAMVARLLVSRYRRFSRANLGTISIGRGLKL